MPVSCYLCGRDFGSRSIAIHVPHCAKKWEDEQRKLPKSLRRSPPQAPDNLDRVMAGQLEGEELKQFNMEAVKMWNQAVLVACQHCKRYLFDTSYSTAGSNISLVPELSSLKSFQNTKKLALKTTLWGTLIAEREKHPCMRT